MQGQHTDADSLVSQPPRQSIAEFIGLGFGGACFAVAWLLSWTFLSWSATITVLPVIVAAFFAGTVATLFTRDTAGVRDGIRAGIVAALIGSSSLIVIAIIQGAGLSELLSTELLAILSFPPSVSVGLIGAILVTFVRHPPNLSLRSRATSTARGYRANLLFRVILGISLLCYLAPILLLFWPSKPKVEISEAPPPTPSPAVPTPTPIPWSYEKPADFETLPGRSVGIVDQKQIQAIADNLPMAISPDGSQFAFFTSKGQQATFHVVNLNTLTDTVSIPFPRAFTRMSWSPDSKRIFYLPTKDTNLAGVIDIAARRVIELPIPNNRHLPDTPAHWWHAQEIAFPKDKLILDLDTLQLIAPAESKNFAALTEDEKRQWFEPSISWKSPSKWTLDFIKRVESYDILPVEGFVAGFQYNVAISDNDIAFSRAIRATEIWEGDRVLAAADGSKLIRVRENAATVFYMGKSESPMTFTANLPIDDGLKSKSLFVCAPVTNPLNGKVVGADRDRVKASARIISQNNGVATCWVDQEFEQIAAGDIVADSHDWEDGIVKATSDGRTAGPWAPIEIGDPSTFPPERAKTQLLGNVYEAALGDPDGAAQITDLFPKNEGSSQSVSSAVDAAMDTVDAKTKNEIQSFIRRHHQNSSASDIGAVTNDYAHQAEYFDDGIVTHDFIRKDVAAYHAGYTLDEEVLSDLIIQRIVRNVYSVQYQVRVLRQNNSSGKWWRVFAEAQLELAWTPDGFKITKQHAKILSKDQGP